MNKYKAFFFDLDGTIINTEPIHAKALINALNSFNIKIDEEIICKKYHGASDFEVWKQAVNPHYHISFANLVLKKNEYFENLINQMAIDKYLELVTPGATELIQKLHESKYLLGLVTASDKIQTSLIMDKLDIVNYFDIICTVNITYFTKPNPSPYFYALRRHCLKTSEILIFEDSYPGLIAASQSGANVIGVNSSESVKNNDRFKKIRFIDNFRGYHV